MSAVPSPSCSRWSEAASCCNDPRRHSRECPRRAACRPGPGTGQPGRLEDAAAMTPSTLAVEAVALYLRRTPFAKARWRLVDAFLPRLRRIGTGMGQRIVKTRYGFRLHVDLAEWIGQHIFLTGDYERPTSALIRTLAVEGSTVLDVGANIGFFSLLASRSVGATGRVLAFEPVAATCAQLRANLQLNAAGNVAVHELALSDRGGTVAIYEGPGRNRG